MRQYTVYVCVCLCVCVSPKQLFSAFWLIGSQNSSVNSRYFGSFYETATPTVSSQQSVRRAGRRRATHRLRNDRKPGEKKAKQKVSQIRKQQAQTNERERVNKHILSPERKEHYRPIILIRVCAAQINVHNQFCTILLQNWVHSASILISFLTLMTWKHWVMAWLRHSHINTLVKLKLNKYCE